MKDNRFNFRMEDELRRELEDLAKPSNMKIATLMKAILWTHINKQKKNVAPQAAVQDVSKKFVPPKEIIVTEKSGRQIVKNEFVDE